MIASICPPRQRNVAMISRSCRASSIVTSSRRQALARAWSTTTPPRPATGARRDPRRRGRGRRLGAKRLRPLALQRCRNQTVVGIDRLVAPLGKPRLVPAVLKIQLPTAQRAQAAFSNITGRLPGRLHPRRRDRIKKQTGNFRINALAACRLTPAAPARSIPLPALIPPARLAGVDGHRESAAAADRETLGQSRPFPRRGRRPEPWGAGQLLLDFKSFCPTDISFMRLRLKNIPALLDRPQRRTVVTNAAFEAVGIGAAHRRVGEDALHPFIARRAPFQWAPRVPARGNILARLTQQHRRLAGRTGLPNTRKDRCNRRLNPGIRILPQSRAIPHKSDRNARVQLSTKRRVPLSALHPGANKRQLRGAHASLEPICSTVRYVGQHEQPTVITSFFSKLPDIIFVLQIAFSCSSRPPRAFHRGSSPPSPGQVDFIASSFALRSTSA